MKEKREREGWACAARRLDSGASAVRTNGGNYQNGSLSLSLYRGQQKKHKREIEEGAEDRGSLFD